MISGHADVVGAALDHLQDGVEYADLREELGGRNQLSPAQ
jgi:hypothetical protein